MHSLTSFGNKGGLHDGNRAQCCIVNRNDAARQWEPGGKVNLTNPVRTYRERVTPGLV